MRNRLRTASLVALVAAAAPALQAQGADPHATVTVGTATAERGKLAYGVIRVGAGSDSATTIQIAVINGAKRGPVMALVSGAHGTEYTSIVALTKVIAAIDPATLSGTVIVVPLLNVSSFERMVPHLNPVDGKGMNAGYPGDANGSQSLRVVAAVAEQVVKQADIVIDLHGGDLDEDLRPYSYWVRSGKAAQDKATKSLAHAFGLDMIVVRDVDVTNPATTRSLSGYSLARGKTILIAEAGRSGLVTAGETAALVSGVLNALGHSNMIPREVAPPRTIHYVGADQRIRADSGGMFFAMAERGSKVTKGAKIGRITDYVGRPMGDVLAPQDGIITFIRGVPSMSKGATLVTVAKSYGATPPVYVKPVP